MRPTEARNRTRAALAHVILALVLYVGASFVFLTLTQGCATLKNVARSVNDVARAACELFGRTNPEEFSYLVHQTIPSLASDSPKGFDPHALCAIDKIVAPFLDEQLKLQQETAARLRASMRSPNADLPQ